MKKIIPKILKWIFNYCACSQLGICKIVHSEANNPCHNCAIKFAYSWKQFYHFQIVFPIALYAWFMLDFHFYLAENPNGQFEKMNLLVLLLILFESLKLWTQWQCFQLQMIANKLVKTKNLPSNHFDYCCENISKLNQEHFFIFKCPLKLLCFVRLRWTQNEKFHPANFLPIWNWIQQKNNDNIAIIL